METEWCANGIRVMNKINLSHQGGVTVARLDRARSKFDERAIINSDESEYHSLSSKLYDLI